LSVHIDILDCTACGGADKYSMMGNVVSGNYLWNIPPADIYTWGGT